MIIVNRMWSTLGVHILVSALSQLKIEALKLSFRESWRQWFEERMNVTIWVDSIYKQLTLPISSSLSLEVHLPLVGCHHCIGPIQSEVISIRGYECPHSACKSKEWTLLLTQTPSPLATPIFEGNIINYDWITVDIFTMRHVGYRSPMQVWCLWHLQHGRKEKKIETCFLAACTC